MKTICHHVARFKDRSKNTIAVKHKKDEIWKSLSWPEYYDQIESIASALLAVGVKKETRITILSNTRLEWAVCDHAIMGIGAITVPIYQTATSDDMKYILNNSESEILFIENKALLKAFLQVANQCPRIQKIITFENTGSTEKNVTSWSDFFALGAQERVTHHDEFQKRCADSKLTDTATLLYTSGTTGSPKGVVLTHEQIMSEITEVFPYVGANSTDISLTFLPYAHVMGRIEHWGHAIIGYTMAFAESIERVKNNLQEIHPTFLIAVPRIFEKIYSGINAQMDASPIKGQLFKWAVDVGTRAGEFRMRREPLPLKLVAEYTLAKKLVLAKVKEAFGGQVRFTVSGGAPLAREIALFFHACDILVLEGYGLTETTAAICVNTPYSYKFGTVGKPVGDVQLKFAEDGEILVKSKKVMREYYKDPESTAKALVDGWFHTGDIGELTPTGDLRITDRKKDLIKTAGGKYVAPQRLENLLKLNSFVSNVLIHGDQKKYIVALITLDPAAVKKFAEQHGIHESDYAKLTQNPAVLEMVRKGVAATNSSLASFESIKKFAVLPSDFSVESGELTPSLKVKRKVLDKKYHEQIEALYS